MNILPQIPDDILLRARVCVDAHQDPNLAKALELARAANDLIDSIGVRHRTREQALESILGSLRTSHLDLTEAGPLVQDSHTTSTYSDSHFQRGMLLGPHLVLGYGLNSHRSSAIFADIVQEIYPTGVLDMRRFWGKFLTGNSDGTGILSPRFGVQSYTFERGFLETKRLGSKGRKTKWTLLVHEGGKTRETLIQDWTYDEEQE